MPKRTVFIMGRPSGSVHALPFRDLVVEYFREDPCFDEDEALEEYADDIARYGPPENEELARSRCALVMCSLIAGRKAERGE